MLFLLKHQLVKLLLSVCMCVSGVRCMSKCSLCVCYVVDVKTVNGSQIKLKSICSMISNKTY